MARSSPLHPYAHPYQDDTRWYQVDEMGPWAPGGVLTIIMQKAHILDRILLQGVIICIRLPPR